MGYSPYRKYRAKPADYAAVIAALVIAAALVAWAQAHVNCFNRQHGWRQAARLGCGQKRAAR